MNIKDYVKIYVDEKEPFKIDAVGTEIYRKTSQSKSFKRTLLVSGEVDYIIEYAVYWNYDIEHMYDLEHIWLYMDKDDQIHYAECSFHGKYLKAIMPDGSNLTNNQLTLYCQPGKHAFSATPLVFRLLPNYYECCRKTVGKEGLLITSVLEGHMHTNDLLDKKVKDYMQQYAFVLADKFVLYEEAIPMMTYDELIHDIPVMLRKELSRIDREYK